MPRPFWCALQPWVTDYQQFGSVSRLPGSLPESGCLTRAGTPPLSADPSHAPSRAETSTAAPVRKTRSTRVWLWARLLGSALQLIAAAFLLCLHSRPLHCTQIPASHALHCPVNTLHPAPHLSTASSLSPKAPWVLLGLHPQLPQVLLLPDPSPTSPLSISRIFQPLSMPSESTLARTCWRVLSLLE